MDCFNYEGGHGVHILRRLKEAVAKAVVKYFQFSNNAKLNNNIVFIILWSLVTV